MIKTVVIVVVVLVAGVLIYAATKPDSFGVQRSASIKAPPEKIYPLISDFKQWPTWSPYEHKDPAMKRTLGAVTAGPGATYAWDGNKDVGQGDMTITGVTAPTLVTIRLHFVRPFEGTNQVDFRLEPQGEATRVTWDMRGPAPYVTKLMSTFFDMDKMIGKDFEAGLANLKAAVEK
jgi:hypothetical protein